MERDDFLWNADETKFHFNSHAHVERDRVFAIFVKFFTNFNSHAHVERDGKTYAVCEQEINFNSHAHVERDLSNGQFNSTVYISTHTLTWSVTSGNIGGMVSSAISTHTLTWSVTCVVQISVVVQKFQLTRSRGA